MPGNDLMITVDHAPEAVVMTIVGEVDVSNALRTARPPRAGRNRRRLGDEIEVILQDPPEHIRRMLEITALDRLFPMRSDPKAAVSA